MQSETLLRKYALVGVGTLLLLTIVFLQMEGPIPRWCANVGMGGIFLLTIVFLSKKTKLFLGRFSPPNWTSVLHVPVGWIGYFWLYEGGSLFWAIQCMALSGGLDKLDGGSARAYDELVGKPLADERFWTQMNHRGTTPLGKVLDPFMDKVTMTPMFIDVCVDFLRRARAEGNTTNIWLLYTGVCLIILMILTDVFGQLIRLDYFRNWRRTTDNGSIWAGKYKSLGQWLWLLFLPPMEYGWLSDYVLTRYLIVLVVLLTGMLALAVLSVVGKIRPLQEAWTKTLLF